MEVLLWQREDSGVVAKSGDVYKHGDYGGTALAEVAITEVLLYLFIKFLRISCFLDKKRMKINQ